MQVFEETLIAKLLSKFAVVYGRKALQKYAYLYQAIGGIPLSDYDFMWSRYGPYSVDLARDLQFAVSTGDVTMGSRYNEIGPYEGLEVSLSAEETDSLDKLGDMTRGFKPNDLELLASVHYAVVKGGLPKDRDQVFGYIDIVKPGRFDRESFERMWGILASHHLI